MQRGSAVIGGVLIREADGQSTGAPEAVVFHNNQQYQIPINCVCNDNGCIDFPIEEAHFDACITLIPVFQSQTQGVPEGALIYNSKRVRDGLFARAYVQKRVPDYLEVAYDDGTPLAIYQGRLIGPIRIYKVNYPASAEKDDFYLQTSGEINI